MRVTLRPAVADDLKPFTDENLPCRIRALTGEVDGKVVGVGGFGYRPDGTVEAFVQMLPEARAYPVAIHRAALTMLATARGLGLKVIYAAADPSIEPAERWLIRLGFKDTGRSWHGQKVFAWQN